MTRALASVLAVVLSSSAAVAAVQIAPLELRFGDMIGDDSSPRAASNGTTTVVAWTKSSFVSPSLSNVYGARPAP